MSNALHRHCHRGCKAHTAKHLAAALCCGTLQWHQNTAINIWQQHLQRHQHASSKAHTALERHPATAPVQKHAGKQDSSGLSKHHAQLEKHIKNKARQTDRNTTTKHQYQHKHPVFKVPTTAPSTATLLSKRVLTQPAPAPRTSTDTLPRKRAASSFLFEARTP